MRSPEWVDRRPDGRRGRISHVMTRIDLGRPGGASDFLAKRGVAMIPRSRAQIRAVLGAYLALIGLSAIALSARPTGEGSLPCSTLKPVPADLLVRDLEGRDVRLSALGSRAVLVHVWSTFDRASQSQVGLLIELDSKFRAKGLGVVALSGDDSPDTLRMFARDHAITYTLVTPGSDGRLRSVFGAKGVGHLTLFLPDGRVCAEYTSKVLVQQVENDIAAQLGPRAKR